ncbi:MAG TPA: DNA repair protein RecN, partial [Atribacteraceae bacterium]|nr:DNA repair protein RecN [Atribacteraceae bacterium]
VLGNGYTKTYRILMLKELSIKNFVLVDFQELHFERGLNVITGETGTGKSLIIDALLLLLGTRAREEAVRKNQQSALIEAAFGYDPSSPVEQWLLSQDLLGELSREVVLSREISQEGKTRSRINGRTVTLGDLRTLGGLLVDIYGQGEDENFFLPSRQLALLDTFLDQGGRAARNEYQNFHRKLTTLQKELEEMNKAYDGNIDDVRFALQEMSDLGLSPDTLLELDEAFQLAADAQGYRETLDIFLALCQGGEEGGGILHALARARQALETAPGPGPEGILTRLSGSLKTIEVELREVLCEVGKIHGKLDLNPDEFARLEKQVAETERIKRKHRIRTTGELIEFQGNLKLVLSQAEGLERQKRDIAQECRSYVRRLLDAGTRLSEARRQAASQMKAVLEDELRQLAFNRVEFEIRFTDHGKEESNFKPDGLDEVEFAVSLNPGEKPGPVRLVASGGEISRIILGLKSITLEKSGVGTMVFDEIDQGIGGQTAFWVGEKLKRLSAGHQVLCITHLPQIACYAENHIRVDKRFDREKTWAEITPLHSREERIQELTRMMGGQKRETSALQYAETLLNRAERTGNKSEWGML